MRLAELTTLGNCAVCGRKQLAGAIPLFYVVEITRAGFDADAVRRAAGMEVAFGALGSVMGPDEHLARVIDGPHRVFVHEDCAARILHPAALIPETSKAAHG